MKTVIAISGSLRKESKNTQLLKLAKEISPKEDLQIVLWDVKDIPFFNEDIEQHPPTSVVLLREAVSNVDGLLLAVNEYNFLPGPVIKNVIDWLSRGGVNSVLVGKTVGLVSVAGYEGGLNAQNSIFYSLKRMQWLNLRLIDRPLLTIKASSMTSEGFSEQHKNILKEILNSY